MSTTYLKTATCPHCNKEYEIEKQGVQISHIHCPICKVILPKLKTSSSSSSPTQILT